MSASPVPQPRRYAMFISYRHADNLEMGRKWATWLHESVENYDIPIDLIGKTNLRNEPVPSTLYPVFRDEEELPADADLSNNIRRALENSELLVVLCSPRAVQSRFVADEIRYFKELGKSSRILALILDGEPNASDDPEKIARLGAAAECFPEPLRFGVPDENGVVDWTARTEPIAADCRPGGHPVQGWTTAAAYEAAFEGQSISRAERATAVREYGERLELAKLKVIAGAIGMPLGELTRRDKVRQLQRARKRARLLMVLSSVFALLAIAAGGLGWVANQRRKEANVQRQAAMEARTLADERRVEADGQRKVAVSAQGEAETARRQAEMEKRQAMTTLANSDFQEGINRLADPTTAPAGLAFLARSARAGHESAAIRIWTLFQRQPFWLPAVAAETTPPPAYVKHLMSGEPPDAFQSLKLKGTTLAPTWYAESADGQRCITVISDAIAGEGGNITFRFWETSGKPIGPWHELVYDGDQYLSGIVGATLSPDGRFAAIIASPWRMPQYLEVWDVNRGKKIGDAIVADGAQPNSQGGAFTDAWFLSADDRRPGPLLATLSNRGTASIHWLDPDPDSPSMFPLVTHPHSQSVNVATIDVKAGLFVSSAMDRSIRISRLFEEGAAAWPLSAAAGISGLQIDTPERFSALLDDGTTARWDFSKPQTVTAPTRKLLEANELAGLDKVWPAGEEETVPPAPPVRRGALELRTRGSELQAMETQPAEKVLWSHRFSAPIAFARFIDDRKIVVQTEFYMTEVWDLSANARLHPVIDETPLFVGETAADTVLLSSLSPDGKLALTRSFQWVPPNVGVYGFTVWDLASGKPLTDRRVSYANDALDEIPETHAEFSSDGRFVWFGQVGKDVPKSVTGFLELSPPPAVLPLIPDLAEALSGQKLQPDGNLTPVIADPAPVLDRVIKALATP